MGLDVVEFWLAVDAEFGVDVEYLPSERLRDIHGQVVEALCREGKAIEPDAVWDRLRRVASEQSGVKTYHITPDTDIVRDLGLSQ
jgi:hypothetical protein